MKCIRCGKEITDADVKVLRRSIGDFKGRCVNCYYRYTVIWLMRIFTITMVVLLGLIYLLPAPSTTSQSHSETLAETMDRIEEKRFGKGFKKLSEADKDAIVHERYLETRRQYGFKDEEPKVVVVIPEGQ